MKKEEKYLKTPEWPYASQHQAKQALDSIKKTDLWPEPYLVSYKTKKSDEPKVVFCWIFTDNKTTEALLPAYPIPEDVQFRYKGRHLQHLSENEFFLMDNLLYVLRKTPEDGYIVKKISYYFDMELAGHYAMLKYGKKMFWRLRYSTCGNQPLGIIWDGAINQDDKYPDIMLSVWPEDKQNFVGRRFSDIQLQNIPSNSIISHYDDYYVIEEDEETIRIIPAEEKFGNLHF